jgi:hypothetical protein
MALRSDHRQFTPHGFHALVNRWRPGDRRPFPTRYRANTPTAIVRYAARCGFEVLEIKLMEGRPEYLRLSWPTYLMGWLYERLVNLVPGLKRFRVVMVAVLRKPASAAAFVEGDLVQPLAA